MVLATTLLVALVTITFSQIFLYQSKQALINNFTRQGESLTENLALNAELGLLLEDLENLEALGQNLLKEDTVKCVRIISHNGKILVDMRKEKEDEKQQKTFTSPVVLSRPEDELSVFISHRKAGEIQEIGKVEVTFSQKKLLGIISKIKWRIYTFAFFGFIFGGILSYYLSWITLKSIKRLVQASKAIAEGDWEMRVEESGDDEIGQLIRDFNRMAASLVKKRQELEESYRKLARQERMAEIGKFSTIIAHELKNPLGIIKGSINILAKKNTSKETRETMVKYINEEVTRLNQLAEEFLVFARPAPPKKENIDLSEIIYKLKVLAESQREEEKAVKVKIESEEEGVIIHADKNQVFQALLNLLENGIQSSPEGEVVTIAFRTEGGGVKIEISDNGPGVRPEDREKVFEPFFTRKEKGTGLGLSIVKKIVEMHAGRINLSESKTGGACFTIWLPKKNANV